MIRTVLGIIAIAVVTLGGGVLLLVWFAGMTPIHVIEEPELTSGPPNPQQIVDRGAIALVVGEVEAVYGPEWSSPDRSRPGTPWDISSVPDEVWIHTPILISLDDEIVTLHEQTVDVLPETGANDPLLLAVRGGEIGDDLYEINDGQDRSFELGDQVALVLGVQYSDMAEPELISTTFGDGWDLIVRYQVEDDTAILQWGDDTYEQPLDELIESYRAVSR